MLVKSAICKKRLVFSQGFAIIEADIIASQGGRSYELSHFHIDPSVFQARRRDAERADLAAHRGGLPFSGFQLSRLGGGSGLPVLVGGLARVD